MMAMTTRSSISVKPRRDFVERQDKCMIFPPDDNGEANAR